MNLGDGTRRIIGIELRVGEGNGRQQEEVFMHELNVVLPPLYPGSYGHDWSVTLHTTYGDVTMDTRSGQGQANIR